MGVPDASDSRLAALTRWVASDLGFSGCRIEPASADASFRRYFRLTRGTDTYIVMDAPPQHENSAPFVHVAHMLAGMGLNVPIVLAKDLEHGFLLLSDLGSRQYLDELQAGRDVDGLYAQALSALVIMQTSGEPAAGEPAAGEPAAGEPAAGEPAAGASGAGASAARELPPYDRDLLLREMTLFPEWFLGRHLGLALGAAERAMIDRVFAVLVRSAAAQPTAFVHRDYHSRNLLLTPHDNPGILDFQDAVWGPITYDAVSLLKDCYIAWPAARVRQWLRDYRGQLLTAGFAVGADEQEFERWFDLMGLQRHIKVLGIFARLFYRDGKPGYLKDLPRVLEYTRAAAAAYDETAEFARFLTTHVDAAFAAAQARVGV